MMGRQSRQMAMIFVDIESLIPENHLLRKIERMVSFDFIYDLLAPYYPATGRPSVDPVSMFKMLLIGYLYGIKSERRLVEEVQLNIAYRWFCGFELDDTIPNHSTFSKTRTRKWQQSSLFQKAFYEIVKQCIDSGLIDGEAMAADGSYIPANVSRESWINVEIEVEQSMQSYLDSLDEELSNQPGFKKPPTKIVRKCRTTSQTDPDSGYINHGSKRGIGYLMEATVDCKHGILTGVDVYSANEKESVLILRHLERQINLGIPMSRLALDRGYETGAVHRGLELLGITGYIPAIQFSNPPEKIWIHHIGNIHKYARREDVPEKTMFIITTDGYENASRRYDYERVRRMIERQKERYGWEFLFLGANIDAAKEAARFGIGADRSVNYKCDEAGTALNYEVIGEAVCSVRAARPLSADWKRRIDEDVQRRGR